MRSFGGWCWKKAQGTSGCSSPRYVGWKDQLPAAKLSAANCQLPADSTHLETIQRFRLVRLLMTSAMMSLITSKGTYAVACWSRIEMHFREAHNLLEHWWSAEPTLLFLNRMLIKSTLMNFRRFWDSDRPIFKNTQLWRQKKKNA